MTHDCPVPGCQISFITDQSLRTHMTRKHPHIMEQLKEIKGEVEEARGVLQVYQHLPSANWSTATKRLIKDMEKKINRAKEDLQKLGYSGSWIPLE